jgi:mannose-6-phosphate isomerase class I
MACSDNVVRAGLTPKHKDVETLCSMLTYSCEPASEKRFHGIQEDEYTLRFSPPIQDFSVAKISVSMTHVYYHCLMHIYVHKRCIILTSPNEFSRSVEGNMMFQEVSVRCLNLCREAHINNKVAIFPTCFCS